MKDLVIFCKSYRADAARARRLVESIESYNKDGLPLFFSVPHEDRDLFHAQLKGLSCQLLCDEDIAATNGRLDAARLKTIPGYRSQQVIKAEFWRLGLSANCVCVDSDSFFIRPFHKADFMASEGVPFTVIHEAKDYLQYLVNIGKENPLRDQKSKAEFFKRYFPENPSTYLFAPTPAIWSSTVWRLLDENVLLPRGMTIQDAINERAAELDWYGHAYLKFRPFPLFPREPLFRVYHYPELYWRLQSHGETLEKISGNFLGIVEQSFWDRKLEPSAQKRIGRWIKQARTRLFRRW